MHLLTALIVASSLVAADADPQPAPAPAPAANQPTAVRLPQTMGRMPMYDVEQIAVTPGDANGLAAWAEMAARGFHLVSVTVQDGRQILFLERPTNANQPEPHIPAGVAGNPAAAEALKESLRRIQAERMPPRRAATKDDRPADGKTP